jgi:hypothetical protein
MGFFTELLMNNFITLVLLIHATAPHRIILTGVYSNVYYHRNTFAGKVHIL